MNGTMGRRRPGSRKTLHVRQPQGALRHDLRALECLEVVLISAAFDQDVSVVFGRWCLPVEKNQDTTGIGMKNFSNTYRALDDYDVEKIYVEKESLEARGLTAEDLIIPVEVVSTAENLREIMAQQDVVISS